MVNVKTESVIDEVSKLPEIIQKEWYTATRYYSQKEDTVVFEEFKKRYDNFEGATINDILAYCLY
jgi:hypothetical protein